MKLTVVLPNYNHARWLPESLGAILAQSRPADEFLVIDDASTDGSVAVMQRMLASIPYARMIRNPTNVGCMPSMNAGLRLATGDLIYFAAADDRVERDLFARSLEMLQAYPNAALCSAFSSVIDNSGQRVGRASSGDTISAMGFIPPRTVKDMLMRDDSWFIGNTVIYRRKFLLEAGGFPEALAGFSDGFMCRGLASRHGCCFIPQELAAWRRMEGGMAWSLSADLTKSEAIADIATKVAAEIFPTDLPEGYMQRWRRRYIFSAHRFQAGRNVSEGSLRGVLEGILRLVAVGLRFAYMRPFDILPVLKRRALNKLIG